VNPVSGWVERCSVSRVSLPVRHWSFTLRRLPATVEVSAVGPEGAGALEAASAKPAASRQTSDAQTTNKNLVWRNVPTLSPSMAGGKT
jgi:hypothetical protein